MSVDIYFAGSRTVKGENFMLENSCNRLLSFVNDKTTIKTWLEYDRGGKLFVDSGAFTAWTKGIELDVDKYLEFLNANHEKIQLYAQVDVIPGTRGGKATLAQVKEAAQKSWENYLYMRERLIEPDKLIYAFHAGEPFEYLVQALTYEDKKGKIPYIALGGIVGKPKTIKENFLTECFNYINKYNPEVKTHVFGITTFNILEKYNVTSADSTTHIQSGCNGNIICDYGIVCLSDRKTFVNSEYLQQTDEYKAKINEHVKEFGYTIDELITSANDRILFNVMYVKDRAAKLQRVKKTRTKRLF